MQDARVGPGAGRADLRGDAWVQHRARVRLPLPGVPPGGGPAPPPLGAVPPDDLLPGRIRAR